MKTSTNTNLNTNTAAGYETQPIRTVKDMSFFGSIKVIGKIVTGSVTQGAGATSGVLKATALALLSTEEGSWADNTLKHGHAQQFQNVEDRTFNATSKAYTSIKETLSWDSMTEEESKAKEEELDKDTRALANQL